VRADVPTTALADGEHRLEATSTTGETATRLLVTDNTAPKVVASTPAAGATLTSSVPLAVELDDPSGVVAGPDVTLDGEPVAPGELVGPGLEPGEHTLAVSGTDGLGNAATREIVFTSAGIPDVPTETAPESGATGLDGAVELSARVATPGGGDVTATFSQARVLTPTQAWQGSATEVPTTLRVEGERNVGGTKALAPGDAGTLASDASADVAYQRFDVQLEGHVSTPVVRWEGAVDPARVATLRVWDVVDGEWDAVGSSRGVAEGSTVLEATVEPRHVDGRQVHVLVTGEDPFADDIDPGAHDRFEDPEDYDFSIVHFTDTQYLAEGAVEQETAEERGVWESAYRGIVDWIAENKDERKISYVAHTGDITENNIRPPATDAMRRQVTGEFEVTSRLQATLDEAGVPNGVLAGNHDNRSGMETGPDSTFNSYFGPDRYAAAAERWQDAEYGGPWREGDNQNHYDLFSAGGLDFVVVGLSYGVTREEAEWADAIFEKYPDRNGILLTHSYLSAGSRPDGRESRFAAPDGSPVFKQVVEPNPNVFLVLAGHIHGVGTNVKPEVGEVAHGVVELLADYQAYTVSADRLGLTQVGGYAPDAQLRFGASFLRMLQFDVDRGEMFVDTYSPFLDDFGATEFDTSPRWNGLEDNMVLPVDLTSRTTSITTDTLAVYDPVAAIGETTVASGEVATVEWSGLKPGTTYAWLVTARSEGGGVTSAAPSVLTTAGKR
jgi:hypothetical protein